LILFGLGGLGDVAYHTGGPSWLAPLLGGNGHKAHLITFVGMALIVAGLTVGALTGTQERKG
jgi:hypothetical protein